MTNLDCIENEPSSYHAKSSNQEWNEYLRQDSEPCFPVMFGDERFSGVPAPHAIACGDLGSRLGAMETHNNVPSGDSGGGVSVAGERLHWWLDGKYWPARRRHDHEVTPVLYRFLTLSATRFVKKKLFLPLLAVT